MTSTSPRRTTMPFLSSTALKDVQGLTKSPDFDERAIQDGVEATRAAKALKVGPYGYQVVGGVLRR